MKISEYSEMEEIGITDQKARAMVIMAVVALCAFTCIAYADTGVPAVPEIQGLVTGTGMSVQGTVTETDSGVWSITDNPYDGIPLSGADPLLSQYPNFDKLFSDASWWPTYQGFLGLWNAYITTNPDGNLQSFLALGHSQANQDLENWLIANTKGGLHSGVLNLGQVQYTAGYNDQYSGISGQQTFVKSMALSTANKIADQSNIKASTDIQFIAIDTGRATRTEDLLLDGAAQARDSANLILCPFANANPGIIPAFCNIEQAGSAFDTTLTSTVTSADTRFVGTDATIPVVLNYNINAQGITLSDGSSSPMIGSVSAFMKVHVQEARNESTISSGTGSSIPDRIHPVKSEDVTYSETSTASGLISRFAKSMSYSSQASAVSPPATVLPVIPPP